MNNDLKFPEPFEHASQMETPLAIVADLLRGLAMIAETMDQDHAVVVNQIVFLALRECDTLKKHYGHLFKLTHPNRDRFEREGWPA